MKFFTKEIMGDCGSLDDDTADKAYDDFEVACEALRKHEESLDYPFPMLLGKEVYMGDAEVIQSGINTLILLLEKRKKDPQKTVELTFHGADIPKIGDGCRLYYNQREADKEGDTYIYRILLSCSKCDTVCGGKVMKNGHGNGHEVEIRFKDLSVKKYGEKSR